MNDGTKNKLIRAITLILRPLLRVLIRQELSFAEFAEVAKQAYVDVAYDHFSIPKRKTTYSRVAVLTGLSRKEVVRLAKLRNMPFPPVKVLPNRAQRVVNGWLTDAEFLNHKKMPMVLPVQGECASFAALVSRYSGDITLGAVIDELERVAVVRRPDKNTVELLSTGYVPHADDLDKIRIMSVCTGDLLNTAVHNLDCETTETRLQRQVTYANLSAESVAEFKAYSEQKAAELLQHMNQYLSHLTTKDNEQDTPRHRVGWGIYYIESEQPKEENHHV